MFKNIFLFVLLLVFINHGDLSVEDERSDTVMHQSAAFTGIFLKRIQGVRLYETFYLIPLIIPPPSNSFVHDLPNSVFLDKNLSQGDIDIRKAFLAWMVSETPVVHDSHLVRTKRFLDHGILPFWGWIQQKIGGVAMTSDLDDLRVQSTELSKYVDELKTVMSHHGHDISKLFTETETLQSEMFDLTAKMNTFVDKVGKMSDHLSDMETVILNLYKSVYIYIHYVTSVISYHRSISRFSLILDTCYGGHLTHLAYTWVEMVEKIKDWKTKCLSTGLVPVFSEKDYEWIYRQPLVHCHLDAEGIQLILSLPATHKEIHSFNLYKYAKIPFKINETLYHLQFDSKKYWMEINGVLHNLLEFEKLCPTQDSGLIDYCLIRPTSVSVISPMSCEYILYNQGTIEDIRTHCRITKYHDDSPIWMTLNSTTWIYTGSARNITLGNKTHQEQYLIGSRNAITLLQIPCGCYIEDQTEQLILSASDCSYSSVPTVIDLHHAMLLPFDSLSIPGPDGISHFKFDPSKYKTNFTVTIDHHLQELDDLKEDEKTLNKTTPVIEWTSPFHSIWTYILWAVGILVFIIILWCLWKSRSLISPPAAIAFSKISEVKAETDYPVFIDTLFVLICSVITLIVLYLLYKELLYIKRQIKCHHLKTDRMAKYTGPHLDVSFKYHSTPITIALIPLAHPVKAYQPYLGSAFISGHDGYVEVSGASQLKDMYGRMTDFNGMYKCPGVSVFEKTDLFVHS